MNTAVGQKDPRSKAVRGVDSNFLCDRLDVTRKVHASRIVWISVARAAAAASSPSRRAAQRCHVSGVP